MRKKLVAFVGVEFHFYDCVVLFFVFGLYCNFNMLVFNMFDIHLPFINILIELFKAIENVAGLAFVDVVGLIVEGADMTFS